MQKQNRHGALGAVAALRSQILPLFGKKVKKSKTTAKKDAGFGRFQGKKADRRINSGKLAFRPVHPPPQNSKNPAPRGEMETKKARLCQKIHDSLVHPLELNTIMLFCNIINPQGNALAQSIVMLPKAHLDWRQVPIRLIVGLRKPGFFIPFIPEVSGDGFLATSGNGRFLFPLRELRAPGKWRPQDGRHFLIRDSAIALPRPYRCAPNLRGLAGSWTGFAIW